MGFKVLTAIIIVFFFNFLGFGAVLMGFSRGKWRQYVSPKRRHRPTHQNGAKTQKIKKHKETCP
jgi:hypothetical protein